MKSLNKNCYFECYIRDRTENLPLDNKMNGQLKQMIMAVNKSFQILLLMFHKKSRQWLCKLFACYMANSQ